MERALLRELLEGSWRAQPEVFARAAEPLAEWVEGMAGAGIGALVWRRLERGALADSEAGVVLRQVHRMQVLEAGMQERFIAQLFQGFAASGIESVLIKGWASARYYGARGLRPFGDLDVHVLPGQIEEARRILQEVLESSDIQLDVDLKGHFETRSLTGIYGRTNEEFIEGAIQVPLGDMLIPVPRLEDHLRLVSLHCLKHGASRAIWLCDVAAALEARTGDFDWERCLGDNRLRRQWVGSVLLLAHELLGADIEGTPLKGTEFKLPRWLAPAVLERWEQDLWMNRREREPELALHGRELWWHQHLETRWKDPITASVLFQVPFQKPVQLPLRVLLYIYSYVPGVKNLYSWLRPKA